MSAADPRSVRDYRRLVAAPPAGYPVRSVPDTYSGDCFAADYPARREAFIEHCLRNPASESIKGYYLELVRLATGEGPVYEGAIEAVLAFIEARHDCADFALLGIIRLLYQFKTSPLLSAQLLERCEGVVLGFKYWPDEPGSDSMCSWTENHQIMFSANEYLAGQLYPEHTFANSGQSGREKMERARRRILDWLDLRFRTGFNEWLSNVYYDEDLTALVNLADFADDPELVVRSSMVADLLLFDLAVNSFRGCFASTHGRSYQREKSDGLRESTADTAKLLFGCGVFSGADNMSAVTLAVSPRYRVPRVLASVANDRPAEPVVNRQRVGIRIDRAAEWGIDRRDPAGAMQLLAFEAYAHPATFAGTLHLFDAFRWWENAFFAPFARRRRVIEFIRRTGLHHLVTRLFRKDLTRNTREEANLITHRTLHYQLSCAQDYHAGFGGDQQHIWQATLGPQAVCYTTHPGSLFDDSPGYWTGSGTLPRAVQIENVVVVLYRISRAPGLYLTNRLFFTHAWLPVEHFDEVIDRGSWVFARSGEAYLALCSSRPHRWLGPEERETPSRRSDLRRIEALSGRGAPEDDGTRPPREAVEVRAEGPSCAWICELGGPERDGSFEAFADRILAAPLRIAPNHLRLRYDSPSVGRLELGWRGPLRRKGVPVALDAYPRYDNPYCHAPFPPDRITVQCGGERLDLDWGRGIRAASEYL